MLAVPRPCASPQAFNMIEPSRPNWTVGASAIACLVAIAGCGTAANAPPTIGVCYTGNQHVDRTIVRDTDCHQTGGTWEKAPK